MARRTFDRQKRQTEPPSQEIMRQYVLALSPDQLHRCPQLFPALDSPHLFANAQPLELEIGCGRADFLCFLAAERPTTNFIGVELSRRSLQAAVTAAASRGLSNIRFVYADFRLLYPLLSPGSLAAVYLHFPDPHARSKFRRRRLFTPRFLDAMHQALEPGGRLSVMTDHEPAFFAMLELAEQDPRWQKAHDERYLVGFEIGVKSRFQRVWEAHGLATLRFELRRPVDLPSRRSSNTDDEIRT